MSKTRKEGLRILFAWILSCGLLTGCGQSGENGQPSGTRVTEEAAESEAVGTTQGEHDYFYAVQQKSLKVPVFMNGDLGWCDGTEIVGDYLFCEVLPTTGVDRHTKLYRIPIYEIFSDAVLTGADSVNYVQEEAEEVPLPERVAQLDWSQNPVAGEFAERFFADGENGLYYLAGAIPREETWLKLYRLDGEGNVLETVDLTEELSDWTFGGMITEAYLEENPSAVDGEGNLYLTNTAEGRLWILSSEYQRKSCVELSGGELAGMAAAENGKVYLAQRQETEVRISLVDSETGALTEALVIEDGRDNGYLTAGGGGGLLYSNKACLYACYPQEGKSELLLTWSEYGVSGRAIQDLKMYDNGNIYVVDSDREMFLLERFSIDQIPAERQKVVLGVLSADDTLKSAVTEFNRRNYFYELELLEYGWENGAQRMETEMVTGSGPDLFSMSEIYVEEYVKKGLIQDLSPYLADGIGLEREDFVEAVLRCNTIDGVLTCIPSSFSLDVLLGRASLLPTERGWTFEEYMEFLKTNEGPVVVNGRTASSTEAEVQEDIVITALMAGLDHYVDLDKGEAYFDREEFVELLEFARQYHCSSLPGTGNQGSTESRIREGAALLGNRMISSMQDYLAGIQIVDGEGRYISYPTADGEARYAIWNSYDTTYGIRAGSPAADGAWAFIEYLLTRENGETGKDIFQTGFPSRQRAFDYMLEQSTVKEYARNKTGDYDYLRDAEGNLIETAKWHVSMSGGTSEGIYAATEEDVAALRQIVDSAVYANNIYGNTLFQMVCEELSSYFNGARSAEETAKVIQNRIQLYLDENS